MAFKQKCNQMNSVTRRQIEVLHRHFPVIYCGGDEAALCMSVAAWTPMEHMQCQTLPTKPSTTYCCHQTSKEVLNIEVGSEEQCNS